MKNGIKLLLLVALGLPALNAGRANIVVHFDRDGNPDEIWSSAGNCRHHLSSHPDDYVKTYSGPSSDPEDCN